ncbi:MATE family efflux transporter [Stetteria hydrogenophila]
MRRRVVEGSVVRAILWLAGPVAASRLLGTVQESVDSILLGRLGKAQLAAPVAVWPLIFLFFGLVFAVNTAGGALVSQLVGARRYDEASRAAGKLWGLTLIIGAASAAAVALLAPVVFRLLGIPGEVYRLSLAYTWIESISMPFAFTMFYFTSLSSSMGDTRKPFWVNGLSSALNLALDPLLIFGLLGLPRMEVVGAALATSISRIVAGGYAAALTASGALGFRVKPQLPDAGVVRLVAKIGGPVGAQTVLTSTAFLVMTGIVAGLGTTAMAAYNVSLAVVGMVQAFTMGFSVALSTVVGQSLGAGLPERAREAAVKGQALLFAILSAGVAVIEAFRNQLAAVFTSDPDVLAEARVMITVFAPSIPFLGLLFTANGVAQGSGATLAPAILSISRLWLLRIPLSYTLAYTLDLGSLGVWLGMSASNIATGVAAVLWIHKGSWLKARALEELRPETLPAAIPASRAGDCDGKNRG